MRRWAHVFSILTDSEKLTFQTSREVAPALRPDLPRAGGGVPPWGTRGCPPAACLCRCVPCALSPAGPAPARPLPLPLPLPLRCALLPVPHPGYPHPSTPGHPCPCACTHPTCPLCPALALARECVAGGVGRPRPPLC